MPNDFFRLIPELKNKKVIKGKLSNLSLYDIENAYKKAKVIIENSLKREIGIFSIYDSEYPEALKSTIDENGKLDAPLLLYYRGNISALKMPTIAIIGTREPNNDGMIAGRYFGKAFSEHFLISLVPVIIYHRVHGLPHISGKLFRIDSVLKESYRQAFHICPRKFIQPHRQECAVQIE